MTSRPIPLVLLVALAGLLAACAGAPSAVPSGSPSAVPPSASPSAPSPTDVPGGVPAPGDGAGAPGDPGDVPGELTFVEPVPGAVQDHEVDVEDMLVAAEGQHVTVRLEWWGGVEPCSVLAGVDVARDDDTFTFRVREGTTDLDAACIEIAVHKATVVDLGELEPGTYTFVALGGADPITVTIS